MSQIEKEFDVLVIGSGPAGYVCAVRAAQLGFKTACIESEETLGGTCLNIGCIPSKALLESSHHFSQAQHEFNDHGIELSEIKLNLKKMLERKDEVVKGNTAGVDYLFKKNKIEWLKGYGSLAGHLTAKLSQKNGTDLFYKAKHIILATGSVPVEIAPAKFDHEHIIDSTDALNLASVPDELLVVGGGAIGLEMGSVWMRLGAKVSVIEAMDRIIPSSDKGIAKELMKVLKKQGMSFHLGTKLEKTEIKDGKVHLYCKSGDKDLELIADKALIAVGRCAFTQGLGLKENGIEIDSRGRILVNSSYETSCPGVYAIGDVIEGPMLAHKGEEEGVAVAEIIAGLAGHVNYEAIPNVVYTSPEMASIGKSEEECKEENRAYNIGKFFFKANGRAKAMNATEGFVKILADKDSDRLLGIHIVGSMASEMIAEAAISFEFGASAEDIARAVHAHPTLAEAMKEAALDVAKRAIHS